MSPCFWCGSIGSFETWIQVKSSELRSFPRVLASSPRISVSPSIRLSVDEIKIAFENPCTSSRSKTCQIVSESRRRTREVDRGRMNSLFLPESIRTIARRWMIQGKKRSPKTQPPPQSTRFGRSGTIASNFDTTKSSTRTKHSKQQLRELLSQHIFQETS